MPLPAALQAKLAKRGLIGSESKEKTSILKRPSEEEEVFAESYDEPKGSKETNASANKQVPNCPNKLNQFHECNNFCVDKYGTKKFQPHPVMEKRRIRMLKIYPLPPNWVEVPDLNTDRYYYWNTETDQVCWISPSHPKAKFEYPKRQKITDPEKVIIQKEAKTYSKTEEKSRDTDRQKHEKKQRKKEDDLDPMDPAAYSDIPRGNWSSGLDL